MARRPKRRDPRQLGGKIISPVENPFGEGTSVIDTRNAVLLEHTHVARVDNPSDRRSMIAVALEGRVNQSSERAEVLYLLDADGAAALVTEVTGLVQRIGGATAAKFSAALQERMDELPKAPEDS